ncbi:MAG TPA: hypothetical protein VNR36_03390 [Pseudolysinimonas sp.]|nr:hypothetical protein [Pseudolysinimonas sp.]
MLDLEVLLTIALFVGGTVLALQVCDAILSVIDARSVRDDDEPDRLTRGRMRELVWSVAVTAALAVIVAFGVDSAGRLVWEQERPVLGALTLVGCGLAAFLVGIVAVVAVVRRERPTYARIRRDLRDRARLALDAAELADFEARLARADRLRERRSRAGTLLRAIGVLTVVVLAALVIATAAGDVRLVLAFGAAVLLSVAAFVVAVRAGSVRMTALEAVLDAQRAEVDALLERARIPQRGKVPGLRDRVARALSILREQQR